MRSANLILVLVLLFGSFGCASAHRHENAPDGGGGDGDIEVDAEVENDDPCAPQDVGDDPAVRCDACEECDARPWVWTGQGCALLPICCACVGADCDETFATRGACREAFGHCPILPDAPEHHGARLIWAAPGGYADVGHTFMIDAWGQMRFWEYGESSLEWDADDPDVTEDIGHHQADILFELLDDIDFDDLPHEITGGGDCYPILRVRFCEGCEELVLRYDIGPQLLPEFREVYEWFERAFCRSVDSEAMPSTFCDFDW